MWRVIPAIALTMAASACGGESTSPPQEAGVVCETVRSIAANMGSTLRGPYASASLAEFVSGSTFFLPAGATDCDRQVLEALKEACQAQPCNSGWSTGGSSLEFCMLRVEAAFYTAHSSCAACGDGVCSGVAGECADDCRCGNGVCEREHSENVIFCGQDCEPSCGDGFCTRYEYCPGTMPSADDEGSSLKDGENADVDVVEEFVACAIDCCSVRCGDGVCHQGVETREICEQDCGIGYCGDGLCIGSEDEQNCASDCSQGVPSHCFNCPDGCVDRAAICGDGACRGCEVLTCAEDCRDSGYSLCPPGTPSEDCPPGSCGDGVCDWGAENVSTCPFDCVLDYAACGAPGTCDARAVSHNCRLTCTVDDAMRVACGDGYCDRYETGSVSPTGELASWYDCADDCGGGVCHGNFFSCLCGNGQCEPWEEDGTRACAADCGGAQ